MEKISEKKLEALEEIFSSYELYKGGIKSELEKEIFKLKEKLDEKEYTKLINAFNLYKRFIFKVLSHSTRVRIKFQSQDESLIDSLDSLIEELDKL